VRSRQQGGSGADGPDGIGFGAAPSGETRKTTPCTVARILAALANFAALRILRISFDTSGKTPA
jgi:hypothetical protein